MTALAPSAIGPDLRLPVNAGRARNTIRFLVLLAMVGAVLLSFWRLSLAGGPPLDDWRWSRDGLERLLNGGPIYAPVLLAGPYHQLTEGFAYTYNLAPSLLPMLLPFAWLPATLQAPVWAILMWTSLLAAFTLVWPERGSRASTALLAMLLVILPPVLFGVWWANASCVVALGTALVIVGDRRGDRRLIVLGLVLAGVAKVLPAIPLALWLIGRRREWRPILVAMALGAMLCVPAVVLFGPHVMVDFIVATGNSQQETGDGNVAPALMLTPEFGAALANLLTMAVTVLLIVLAVRRSTSDRAALVCLLLAICAFVPNLWTHWLLAPMVAAMWWLGPRIMTRLDVVMAPQRASSGFVEPAAQRG